MKNMRTVVKQLQKERDRVARQLAGLNAALSAFVGSYGNTKPTGKKRAMSAAARKRIGDAQRLRWKKVRAEKLKKAA